MNIFKSFLNLFRKKDETQEVLEQLENYAKDNRAKSTLEEVTDFSPIVEIETLPKKRSPRKKKPTTNIKKDQV